MPDDDDFPEIEIVAIGHAISKHQACPSCGGTNFEVRNYDLMWHDGDVHCVDCGAFVRIYDAG